MNWKDDLGQLRLMGPDIPVFSAAIRRVWDHIEQCEREIKEWKAEARRSKWPKESAQEYYALRAMLPSEIGEDTYLWMPKPIQSLYGPIHEDETPTLERCFRRKDHDG